MKIKIIGVITAVLVFCSAPFTIFASAGYLDTMEEHNVIDYSDYITNVTIQDGTDIITCEIPLDFCVIEWSNEAMDDNAYNSGGILVGNEHTVKFYNSPHHNYTWSFYLLGNNFIDSTFIPDGTVFSYTVGATFSMPNPTTNNYGYVNSYAIALNKDFEVETWNSSERKQLITEHEKIFESTFAKSSTTRYFYPMVQFRYTPFDENINYLEGHWFTIKMTKCVMQFSLESAVREQEETNKRNEMLEYIVKTNPDIEQRVAELEKQLADKKAEADNLQNELDNMYKPEVNSLVGEVDTFEIVDEADVGEYTDVFGAILDSDLVKNMMLCCVGIALLSLVLFGKKG